MKITFQNASENITEAMETGRNQRSKRDITRTAKSMSAYELTLTSTSEKSLMVGERSNREKGTTLAEIQQKAESADVAIQQDYMTLMSNTLSEEDYAKLEEEGFRFSDMDPEEAVTIVDKIKAELVKSGQHIVGYTDDLDVETLSQAIGSESLARAIRDSFKQADIPMTEENVNKVVQAWDMTKNLKTPTGGSYHYMIDNELPPEIWNFYLAQSSGAGEGEYSQSGYYAEDVQGYYSQSAALAGYQQRGDADSKLSEQIDKVIKQAGMQVTEENRQAAGWLLFRDLPLTPENLKHLQEVKSVTFPVEQKSFAKAAVTAISRGENPIRGNLAKEENIYEKANDILEKYGNLTDRKQLEEIRLRMTAEVNVKLLKSGFAIDTAPMEELLEAIRQAEAEVAARYFPRDEQAVSKYETYQATNRIVEQLPTMPVQLLGSMPIVGNDATTLENFHEKGLELKQRYDKASESYEALMTAPRRDMGDSIKKAFANVDDILQDLGYDTNDENRRAVRILAYNRMEMSVENIALVKNADEQVRSVVEKMTPAATLKMIRDGVNPLEATFEELNQYFDDLPESYEDAAESYSRFLYGLEKQKEISAQERESFIGIYRLVRQIEKTDGAAIGALVNTQAELGFSNLLSAVRSGKFKSMDVKVTDELGMMEEMVQKGVTISEQIAKGFVTKVQGMLKEISYTGEAKESYQQMELEQIRMAAKADNESLALLQRGELPANAGNLLAAQALMSKGKSPFEEWKNRAKNDTADELYHKLVNVWETMEDKERFAEDYETLLEETLQNVEDMSIMEAVSSLDVKQFQLLHKQLSVAASLARKEEFILPMYIGEELAKVHVTLNRQAGTKGSVNLSVDLSKEEHVEAYFVLKNRDLSGFLVGNTQSEVMKLRQAADIFIDSLRQESSYQLIDGGLKIFSTNQVPANMNINEQTMDGIEESGRPNNAELYQVAKEFLQAMKQQKTR